MKIGVLKNFAKFTGKHLCQSLLFLIKLQVWDSSVFFTKHVRTTAFVAPDIVWNLFIMKIHEAYPKHLFFSNKNDIAKRLKVIEIFSKCSQKSISSLKIKILLIYSWNYIIVPWSISCHWPLYISPKNIRKTLIF